MKRLLVTGSSGLIGSEVVVFFSGDGWEVHGVDNNMRADFFGPQGDTSWNTRRLQDALKHFHHHAVDIRKLVALVMQKFRHHGYLLRFMTGAHRRRDNQNKVARACAPIRPPKAHEARALVFGFEDHFAR